MIVMEITIIIAISPRSREQQILHNIQYYVCIRNPGIEVLISVDAIERPARVVCVRFDTAILLGRSARTWRGSTSDPKT